MPLDLQPVLDLKPVSGGLDLRPVADGVDARTDPFFQTTPSDPYAGAAEEMVRPIVLPEGQAQPPDEPGRQISSQPKSLTEWTKFMVGGMLHPIRQTETAIEQTAIQLGLAKPGSRLLYSPSKALEAPIVTLPHVPPKEGVAGQLAAGTANAVIDLAQFFLTPEGVLMAGLGAVREPIRRAVLLDYSAQMATQAPEQFAEAYKAAKAGDLQTATQHFIGSAGGTLFAAHLAKRGAFAEPAELLKPVEESPIPMTEKAVEAVKQPIVVSAKGEVISGSEQLLGREKTAAPLDSQSTAEADAAFKSGDWMSASVTRMRPPKGYVLRKKSDGMEIYIKEPVRETPAPAPAEATSESGKAAPVAAGAEPLAKATLPAEGVPAKPAEPISMGGATPAELTPTPLKTAVKNAEMDKAREGRGLDPILGPERQKNTEVWDRAMAKIDNDPGWQDRLISELKDKARTPSAEEIVALDHRYADLQNEYSKAVRDGEQHAKDGLEFGMEEAKRRAAFYEERLNDFEQVAKKSLSEWGRAGQMSQRLIKEDFSLASMESRMRAAKGFKPLSEKEHAQIKGLREKLEAAEKALAEAEGKGVEKVTRRAQADVNIVREEFNRSVQVAREKVIWDDMTVFQKTVRTAANVYDAGRLILTTGEFSFVLRQGKMNMLSHPIRTTMAIPSAIRAMRSKEASRRIEHEVLSHPDAAQAKRDGLALMDEGSPLTKQEEIIMGRWGDAIPVVSAFNRAARVFLNKIRFDTWRAMRRSRGNVSPEAGKALAAYVNESTGRGGLGAAEGSAVLLGRAFFAPRWVVSRIQYAIGHSLWKKSDWRTRAVIAGEYARTLTGMGVYYSLLSWYFNDADIEPDLRSSDAAKLRMGDTRLDILTGLAQLATFGARTATGESKTSKGKIVPIRGDQMKYGQADWREYAGRFAWSKAHPIPGAIANLFSGTDLAGNVVTPEGELLKFGQPITYVDIYEALLAQGIPRGTALGLLAWLGEGLQTYGSKPKK